MGSEWNKQTVSTSTQVPHKKCKSPGHLNHDVGCCFDVREHADQRYAALGPYILELPKHWSQVSCFCFRRFKLQYKPRPPKGSKKWNLPTIP